MFFIYLWTPQTLLLRVEWCWWIILHVLCQINLNNPLESLWHLGLLQSFVKSGCPLQSFSKSGCPLQRFAKSGHPVQKFVKCGCPFQSFAKSVCPLQSFDKSGCPSRVLPNLGAPSRVLPNLGAPCRVLPNLGAPPESCQIWMSHPEFLPNLGAPFRVLSNLDGPSIKLKMLIYLKFIIFIILSFSLYLSGHLSNACYFFSNFTCVI